jgi:hypothetical protein
MKRRIHSPRLAALPISSLLAAWAALWCLGLLLNFDSHTFCISLLCHSFIVWNGSLCINLSDLLRAASCWTLFLFWHLHCA